MSYGAVIATVKVAGVIPHRRLLCLSVCHYSERLSWLGINDDLAKK